MPNKTIYVSDDDLPIYQRAQELAGSLSAAITAALRRYVDMADARKDGFEEITVKVGPGKGRKQRFFGVQLVEWGRSDNSRVEVYRVYQSRTGKFVVHLEKSPNWFHDHEGGWRAYLGFGKQSWGFTQGEATLEIFESLETLQKKIPAELFDMVANIADEPAIEDLDI